MITVKTPTSSTLHWNYFLALEQDLEKATRYIEFCKNNLGVFSIELAHLLFAAASEVDVLAKRICKIIKPEAECGNINDYRKTITDAAKLPNQDAAYMPDITTIEISIFRYGMRFKPWENWARKEIPDWWRSYNNVKHERNEYFHEATLQNVVNALGALLILNYHYCRAELAQHYDPPIRWQVSGPLVTCHLHPESILLSLLGDYYANPFEE